MKYKLENGTVIESGETESVIWVNGEPVTKTKIKEIMKGDNNE